MSRPPHQFLTPDEIHTAAAEVLDLAARQGVRVALIGGVAMQHYGSARLTTNVDFAAEGTIDALPAERSLPFGGCATTTPCGVPVS